MSDIFTNLVLRNGDMPSPAILQPRLPSLFEIPHRLEGLPETIPDPEETLSLLQSPVRDSFSPNVESIHFPISVSTSLDKSTIEHSDDDHRFIFRVAVTDTFPSLDLRESTHARVIHAPADTGSYDQSILSSDSLRAETIMSREDQPVVTKPQTDDQRIGEDSVERFIKSRVKSVGPLNKNAQRTESKKTAEISNLNNSSNVILHRENVVRDETPVVQIHIGRIEVRAIMPPPVQSVATTAPAQPRMTLDDYLRQREGRR